MNMQLTFEKGRSLHALFQVRLESLLIGCIQNLERRGKRCDRCISRVPSQP